MLAHAKLSKMFWAEALMITTYIQEEKPKDKGGQSLDDEDTLCLSGWKPYVRNGVYPAERWIPIRSDQPVHG